MKILSVIIVRKDFNGAKIIASEYNLSSINFFQRGTVKEFLAFFSKTIAERTEKGVRQSVEENEHMAHAFTNLAGLCGVIMCDHEYPERVAFALINRVLDEFSVSFPKDVWISTSAALDWPELANMLTKFQNPHEADPIMKVQRELDDTKAVLHETMESLLRRGEKLDDLVAKSDELGAQSKLFFKSAKKTNSCCSIQ